MTNYSDLVDAAEMLSQLKRMYAQESCPAKLGDIMQVSEGKHAGKNMCVYRVTLELKKNPLWLVYGSVLRSDGRATSGRAIIKLQGE